MRLVTTTGGRTLTVREGGDPDGVPVLVHNGTPGSSLLYEPHLRDAEEKGIRLFSYDRPGYGGSTRNRGRRVADCAEDVASVCDALGVERFCVWGISGGGPHALATAALLPDRVAAAAALAPVAPFGAEGLDFYEGMGEQNIEEFRAIFEGEEAHLAVLERDREELLAATPDHLVEVLKTLLGPADREVLTGRIAVFLLESTRAGVQRSLDGWFDDDVAFSQPWGFDLASIRVPVLHWQGEQDRFVPFGHGVWLSEHIPGVESHLSPEDGHITLAERRVPEVHAWLLERFEG
jgi:pimeloyl-ACP methyl ester carboxylesterase